MTRSDPAPKLDQQPPFEQAVAGIGRLVDGLVAWRPAREADRAARRFLSFQLADEEYGIDLSRIREILRPRPVTEIPRTPPFLLGLIAVRGSVMPALDLRLRLGLAARPLSRNARILVAQKEGEPFGLVVDRVLQVVRVAEPAIEPLPPGLALGQIDMLSGLAHVGAARLVALLALDVVLAFEPHAERG